MNNCGQRVMRIAPHLHSSADVTPAPLRKNTFVDISRALRAWAQKHPNPCALRRNPRAAQSPTQ